jgi:hypothetical protein
MKRIKYMGIRLLITGLSIILIANSLSAQALNPGCITTPSQTIFINTAPPAIVATAATGGSCSGAYQYQWQISTNDIQYRDIPGATSANLSYTTPISQTTYFQRKVTCGTEVKYTLSIQISVSSTIYYNVVTSGNFTRNNCAAGGTGSTVTYTVPANTYSSLVSQASANQLAQNDVNANGQNYANANGTCTFYNVVTSGNFARNNCAGGSSGTTVTYTVPANTYSSTVSQAAANQLAQNDVNANGQNYANANGQCVFYNVAASTNFTRNNCSANQQGSTVTYTVPANTYSSAVSQAAADQLAQNDIAANGQNYANTNGTCCTLTFAYSGGISSFTTILTFSGTRVNFTFVFNYPNPSTSFILGNITSTCGRPTGTRTIPISAGGANFNVQISSTGVVSVQFLSGTLPTGAIGLAGIYDLFNNLFYNTAQSGNFTRNDCPPGQVGSTVTYTVAANTYTSIISQADANQQAQNTVNANGQAYAMPLALA